MKRHIATKLAGPVLGIAILISACKKEDSSISNPAETKSTTLRTTGAVADDPSKLKNVPLIVSGDYLQKQYTSLQSAQTKKGGNANGGGSTGTTSDATPPSVTITSPSNGTAVSGTVTINVSASDNISVNGVSLTIDGVLIGTDTYAPYTFTWNATNAADGIHNLTAKATDAAGNYNTSAISVTKNTVVVTQPTLPSNYSLVTPPVGYQGSEFSCAVFATVYAARSIEQYYKTNATGYSFSTNIFSPEFVYNQTKFGDCGAGTAVTTALDFLKSTGVCTWQSMPYSYTNGCSLMPTSSQASEAGNFKIGSYGWLYASDQQAIKTTLINKHAVIISIDPDQSFYDAGPGFVWSAYSGGKTPSHALIICGYDDAKGAYKVMNSWGTTWGDAGYSWITYDFFPYTGPGVCYAIN